MADDNATLHCSVLTPEGPVFQGEARSVSAPGSDGELGILRNHAPIITSLAFGSLKVRTADDVVPKKRRGTIRIQFYSEEELIRLYDRLTQGKQ